MNVDKVDLKIIKEQIINSFQLQVTLNDFYLTPDNIDEVFKLSNIKLEWTPIDGWEEFEYGNSNIENHVFTNMLLKGFNKQKSIVYIVNDDCFLENKCLVTSSSNFLNFVDEVYPSIYNKCFFKPEDLILFMPKEKFISILHHSGYIGHYGEFNI